MPSRISKKLLCSIGSPPVMVKALMPQSRAWSRSRIRLVHAPLAHERRIVGGIEAVDAVIVAFARDHPVHRWEIAVRTEARPAQSDSTSPFWPSDEAVCQEFAASGLSASSGSSLRPSHSVRNANSSAVKLLSVALALDVIRIGNEHPRTQGDIGVQKYNA